MTKRILLVDDECSIRQALTKVLRQENYEVLLAESGPVAIEKYGQDHIDLMLLDLNLPVSNTGWALGWLSRINPVLPIILITDRPYQRALAEKSGADALMEKPLDVPLLLNTIHDLLEQPLQKRVQRAVERIAGFRVVPCDERLFRQILLDRFTVPWAGELDQSERPGAAPSLPKLPTIPTH